jgi:hypothetical protein
MPARLVYSPKCWCFIKNQNNQIIDVSNYVTSGTCNRLINQVSTAEVTIRNPNKIFTKPGKGQVFHPMDPITIFLQRLANQPVRVFTGYLDETVYYQMYPGTITLQASCTLKKLLYTFFDPSLPYVIKFFEKYGWINTGNGSILSPYQAGSGSTNKTPLSKTILNDASISKLLFAVLEEIGEWNSDNVFIEPIPQGSNGVASLMAKLMRSYQQEENSTQQEFTAFMSNVIGDSSYGSSGTTINAANSYNQQSWAEALLQALNMPLTPSNVQAIMGWEAQEGGNWNNSATYNPLNTTQSETGSVGGGTQGNIQAYTSWGSGLQATVTTLTNGLYSGILSALKAGNSSSAVGEAIASSQWGTGSAVINTIANTQVPTISKNVQALGFSGVTTSQRGATDKSNKPIVNVNSLGQITNRNAPWTTTPKNNQTVLQDITEAANAIAAKRYPYSWGGGHNSTFSPSLGGSQDGGGGPQVVGFDCSGSVSAVLYAAGLLTSPQVAGDMLNAISKYTDPGVAPGNDGVTIFACPTHTFMKIGTQYWGTTDGGSPAPGGGAGWDPDQATSTYLAGFQAAHIKPATLAQNYPYTYSLTGSTTAAGGLNTDSSNNIMSTSLATSFVSQLEVPTLEDTVEAIMLGQQGRGLLQDQNLLPFVQQMCQASLRSFMSLPDGDFYAFYPDYFGEMGHHNPYWLIDDIELLDGDIGLTDAYLATDVFAIGDTTWPANNQMVNEIFSAGTITLDNAFISGTTGDVTVNTNAGGGPSTVNNFLNLLEKNEVVDFYKRYGARPLVQDYPMIRSPIFEMLMAYQLFCLAWSRQFVSPFEFTFMPEIFPGGKIGFPSHGIQMFVEQVTHNWSYTSGFTTTAVLTAPAIMDGYSNDDLPPNMVAALVEPIRASNTTATNSQNEEMVANN